MQGTGMQGTGMQGTGMQGTGMRGTGIHDAGSHDAGSHDAGSHDSGSHDAGNQDTGTDDPGIQPPGVGAKVVIADIRESRLSVDEVLEAVQHPRAGGVATFIGVVRERDHGQGVDALDYTAHPSAPRVLRELAERLATEGDVIRVAAVHRVGHLEIGDVAVVVAVSAVHRAPAFEVCRGLIDALKATVPIWKHQLFVDGSDEWVGMP